MFYPPARACDCNRDDRDNRYLAGVFGFKAEEVPAPLLDTALVLLARVYRRLVPFRRPILTL
jgi:hypothetical protein